MSARSLARDWVPPALWRRLRRLAAPAGGFAGDHADWEQAAGLAGGYDDAAIVDAVLKATLAVRAGAASYERDSVLFHQPAPRYPVLAELLEAAIEHNGELEVLEFGGSLGSLYFQHRAHFRHLKRLRWAIVEQPAFVSAGRRHLEDGSLSFHASIAEAGAALRPAVCLASCVLQYLPQPRQVALQLMRSAPKTLFDRLPLLDTVRDRLTVQTVPASIYAASYPAWFFSRAGWSELVASAGLTLANEFTSIDVLELDGRSFPSVGWVLRASAS